MAQTKKPQRLTAKDFDELKRLIRMYQREGKRAQKANAYLASCIMMGSTIETLLLMTVDVHLDEAVATGKYPHRKNKPMPILDLTLFELIAIAKAAAWLPAVLRYGHDDWDAKKAKIGDYTEVAREIRNLAHPGCYARDHHKKRITPKILNMILRITDEVVDSILALLTKNSPIHQG